MTNTKAERTARRGANFGFAAMLFALFGWINLEVLMLTNNPGLRGQLLTCALGLYLSGSAYRRYKIWWAPMARSAYATALRSRSTASQIGNGFTLAVAGFGLAYFMRTGSMITTVLGAGILMFIPWSRSNFCKKYFFVSHGLLVAGWLPVLIIPARSQHPIILLANTWVLWSLAAGLMLITLWLEKSAVATPDKSQAEPSVYGAGI